MFNISLLFINITVLLLLVFYRIFPTNRFSQTHWFEHFWLAYQLIYLVFIYIYLNQTASYITHVWGFYPLLCAYILLLTNYVTKLVALNNSLFYYIFIYISSIYLFYTQNYYCYFFLIEVFTIIIFFIILPQNYIKTAYPKLFAFIFFNFLTTVIFLSTVICTLYRYGTFDIETILFLNTEYSVVLNCLFYTFFIIKTGQSVFLLLQQQFYKFFTPKLLYIYYSVNFLLFLPIICSILGAFVLSTNSSLSIFLFLNLLILWYFFNTQSYNFINLIIFSSGNFSFFFYLLYI